MSEPVLCVEELTYRVVREALTNVRKHSDAGRFSVSVVEQDEMGLMGGQAGAQARQHFMQHAAHRFAVAALVVDRLAPRGEEADQRLHGTVKEVVAERFVREWLGTLMDYDSMAAAVQRLRECEHRADDCGDERRQKILDQRGFNVR